MSERNSDLQIACLLAIKALGKLLQSHDVLIDRIEEPLKSSEEVVVACALDCLKSIGGARAFETLETAEPNLDNWCLRELYVDALEACREKAE